MRKRILSTLAVLVMFCIALVGCGGGGDTQSSDAGKQDEAQEVAADTEKNSKLDQETDKEEAAESEPESGPDYSAAFAGDWVLVAMESEDNDVTEEDLASMRESGMSVDLTFAEDGTCSIVMFGEDYSSGTWEAVTSTVCDVTMEGQHIDVELDPSTGRLRFYQDDEAMIFVRDEGGSSSEPAPAKPAATYDLVDTKGNPTLYSVLELKGSDLIEAIEDEGFEWNSERKWWVSSDGNDCFYVSGNDDYEYVESEIAKLAANGKGDSCVFIIVVDDRDYDDPADAFKKLCNVEVVEEEWLDDDLGIAIVEGPSGTQGFVTITVDDDIGLYVLNIFNEDALSSGLLEEYLGDDYGSTFDELRSNLF